MNDRFEGLSLPQLVELLNDIAVPPAVSQFPSTVGWRIAACWASAVVFLVVIQALLRWRRNRYRRDALACLRRIEERAGDDPAAIEEVGALIKRTAITAFSRERVAPLSGTAWADFLTQTSGDDVRVSAAAAQLSAVAYRSPEDPAAVLAAAQRWILCHRD